MSPSKLANLPQQWRSGAAEFNAAEPGDYTAGWEDAKRQCADELAAALAALADQLAPYLQHKADCATRQFWASLIVPELIDTATCTCGLAEVVQQLGGLAT